MKKLIGVFATDGPNRGDDVRIAVCALAQALWDGFIHGLPSNLSHDTWRLVGWSKPTAVLLEPGITRLVGVSEMPESDDENEILERDARGDQSRRYAQHREEISRLRELLKSYEEILAKHCLSECVCLFEKGLAARAFPKLYETAQKDKDGLILLSELESIGAGVFKVGDFAIFAHSFFRRSLSRLNSLNTPFLSRLQELDRQGFPAKIALDWDMVGLASSYNEHFEFEYWWGPKFNADLANIPVGVTRHEASKTDRLFYDLSHTEFWWHSRDNLHTLEAEEVRDAPARTEDESIKGYFCRYVHSIIDKDTCQIMHFDGAMRGYDEDAMLSRLDCDIKNAGRKSNYTKLWRLDSPISVEQWKGLLNDYYRDNRLVGEYLGADPEQGFVSSTGEIELESAPDSLLVHDYVPHLLESGDGIRLCLSFHPRHVNNEAPRVAVPLSCMDGEMGEIPLLEMPVVELYKLLKRQNETLLLPTNYYAVHPKDMHIDFGLIRHSSAEEKMPQIVGTTLGAIRTLIEAWQKTKIFGSVAFTLAFPLEDHDAHVGILGHVEDVCHWLSNPLCQPPTNKDALFLWLEKVSKFLDTDFPYAGDDSSLIAAVTPFSGSLIRRRRVENLNFEVTSQGLLWKMRQDKIEEDSALWDAIERGVLIPAPRFVVKDSVCGCCKAEYLSCPCIKTLDENTSQEITEVLAVDGIWSNTNMMQAKERKLKK